MEIEYSQKKKEASYRIVKYVFFTGFLAGTLDLSTSFVNYLIISGGKNPVIILYFIASGVFGQFAFTGGAFYWFCGLIFHLVIAYSFTTFYFFIYPKVKPIIRNKYFAGIIFGILTWLLMYLVVLPLSNAPLNGHTPLQFVISVLSLVLFIGLPAAISSESFYYK
jgi:hypothetical protein